MNEININAAEAARGHVTANVDAKKVYEKDINQSEAERTKDISRNIDLSPTEAKIKIDAMVKDPAIRDSLENLAKLCDGSLPALSQERKDLIDSFSKDLSTIEFFRVLQATDATNFGPLGGPAKDVYIEDLLRNPNFVKMIKGKISGFLSGEKIDYDTKPIDDEIIRLTSEKSKKAAEVGTNTTRLSLLERELKEYDTTENPRTHKARGKYAAEVEQLEDDNIALKYKFEALTTSNNLIQTYLNLTASRYPFVLNIGSTSIPFADKSALSNWIGSPEHDSLVDDLKKTKISLETNERKIQKRNEMKIQYEKELEERKKKEESLPKELDELDKKLKEKQDELIKKNESNSQKEKDMKETIRTMFGDVYKETYLRLQTVAGEWQGEQIKTGEQLMQKRLHEYQVAKYITDEGQIPKDKLKTDFNVIKEARPGEGIAKFGAQELASLYSDPLMGPGVRNFLNSVAEFEQDPNLPPGNFRIKIDANTGKFNILNEEKFNDLSTKLTGEMLALQVAKNPNKLKDIFSKDEVLARVFSGDVLPKMIEQAFKENKYVKGLPGFENITKTPLGEVTKNALTKICETIGNHKLLAFMAVLMALGIFLKSR